MDVEEEEFWWFNNSSWVVIFLGVIGGVDDLSINLMVDGVLSLEKLVGESLFVCMVFLDLSVLSGFGYCEVVWVSGWCGKVEWFEMEGEDYGFFVFNFGSYKVVEVMDWVVVFFVD